MLKEPSIDVYRERAVRNAPPVPESVPGEQRAFWEETRAHCFDIYARQHRDHERLLKWQIRLRLMRSGRLPGYPREGKDYLHNLLCAIAPDDGFVQDAIELAVEVDGDLKLSGIPEKDAQIICRRFDGIIERHHIRHHAQAMDSLINQIFEHRAA
jgi:hypothetical protein